MSQYTEKIDKLTLPVVPLGDAVAFPPFPIDFESDSKEAAAAVEAAAGAGMMVFLVSEDSKLAENEFPDNLCRVGTVAKIRVPEYPYTSITLNGKAAEAEMNVTAGTYEILCTK